ncbi:sigma-E factor negative regulatory protein [Halopseudomonas yangmingensis]|uniref:Sigma-E factor negative regulatory protein RseA n=1 Tax=Halopseudomonas yangmingensis TaxID=1720063 RepID=A0A1I4N5W7_9GAMM|nr:sigma-E factor negative regulatory protein [Halopseudomonas yangmingensis]SFM10640.1 sigma-E factor negative regulatory protein RseA [Halopseudomonas yangmingensis]
MSNQSLQESISALMDDQADELELRRVLQRSETDPEVRATWARYQAARAVLHREPWQPGIDLSAGIAAALADEPVPAVQQPLLQRHAAGLMRLGVAASVTLAVLVGVRMFNTADAPQPAMVAEREAPAAWQGSLATAPLPAGLQTVSAQIGEEPVRALQPSAWQEQRLELYLREHAEQSQRMPAVQLVPYARAASLGDN